VVNSLTVWSGVRPLLGLYTNLLFSINTSKRNAFCVFVKKKSQHVLEIFLPNLSDTNKLNYLLKKYLVARPSVLPRWHFFFFETEAKDLP
jgi:hypothetical protein